MKNRFSFLIIFPLALCIPLLVVDFIGTHSLTIQDLKSVSFYALPLAILGYILGSGVDYVAYRKEKSDSIISTHKHFGLKWTIICGCVGLFGSFILFMLPELLANDTMFAGLGIFAMIVMTIPALFTGLIIDLFNRAKK